MELFKARETTKEETLEITPLKFTVKELTQKIKQVLEGHFVYLWVEGEVANFRHSQNGNIYFSLVEEEASLKAVIFKADRNFVPSLEFIKDGDKVLVYGKITFFPRSGEVFLIIKRIELLGIGKLLLQKEYLLKKYQNLFAQPKKPIPLYPRVVAVITSLFGAALEDFLKVARESYGASILVFPVKMQGEGTEQEIAEAVKAINENFPEVEVIVIIRGGGSFEDLAPFYTEEIILALSNSNIPILSGVGHEIDVTICDLIADHRCSTPTAAAQYLFPPKVYIAKQLVNLSQSLKNNLQSYLALVENQVMNVKYKLSNQNPTAQIHTIERRIESFKKEFHQKIQEKLGSLEGRLKFLERALNQQNPLESLHKREKEIATLKHHLENTITQKLKDLTFKIENLRQILWRVSPSTRLKLLEERIKGLNLLLLSLSPFKPLERGYALVKTIPYGTILRQAKDVKAGDRLEILLFQGKLIVEVLKTEE